MSVHKRKKTERIDDHEEQDQAEVKNKSHRKEDDEKIHQSEQLRLQLLQELRDAVCKTDKTI